MLSVYFCNFVEVKVHGECDFTKLIFDSGLTFQSDLTNKFTVCQGQAYSKGQVLLHQCYFPQLLG